MHVLVLPDTMRSVAIRCIRLFPFTRHFIG